MSPEQLNNQIKLATQKLTGISIEPPRKGSSGKQTSVQGTMTFPYIGNTVPFYSSVERDFLLACKLDKRVISVHSQPFTINFSSIENDEARRYTPDYYIERDVSIIPSQFELSTTASKILIEVKREEDLRYISQDDINRYAAAAYWAMHSDERDFLIITETFFSGEQGEAIRLLSGYVGEGFNNVTLALLDLLQRSSPLLLEEANDLLTITGYSLEEAEEAVLLSLANGWLETETFRIPSSGDKLYWRNPDASTDPKTR